MFISKKILEMRALSTSFYTFINDIFDKVNSMHEYIFPITDMQIIVTLYCVPNPIISLLSGFLPVQMLTF